MKTMNLSLACLFRLAHRSCIDPNGATTWESQDRRGSGKTNENGEFISVPLWPNSQYVLTASIEGYSKAETPRLGGGVGEVVDGGKLVIRRARALDIAGVVVDSDGTPIVGASVFCANNKYSQSVTTTDDQGQFSLQKVAPDLKYVFAQHPKFRFGGGQVSNASVSNALEIKLRSKQSPPLGIRALKPLDVERRKEAARELLLQVLDLPMNPRRSSRIQMFRSLDRIDSEMAAELATGNVNRNLGRYIQLARAQRMNIKHAEQVIPLLITTGQRSAFEVARRNCRRLSWSEDKADHAAADAYLKLADDTAGDVLSRQIELAGLYSAREKMAEAEILARRNIHGNKGKENS